MAFPDDKKILEFLLVSVPIACQDPNLAGKLTILGEVYKLSDDKKLEKVKSLKENLNTLKGYIDLLVEKNDEELCEWFSTISRYIKMFTGPYIPK